MKKIYLVDKINELSKEKYALLAHNAKLIEVNMEQARRIKSLEKLIISVSDVVLLRQHLK